MEFNQHIALPTAYVSTIWYVSGRSLSFLYIYPILKCFLLFKTLTNYSLWFLCFKVQAFDVSGSPLFVPIDSKFLYAYNFSSSFLFPSSYMFLFYSIYSIINDFALLSSISYLIIQFTSNYTIRRLRLLVFVFFDFLELSILALYFCVSFIVSKKLIKSFLYLYLPLVFE